MKLFKIFATSILASVMSAGVIGVVFSCKNENKVEVAKADSETKNCIVLDLEDQINTTSKDVRPFIEIRNISVDPVLRYNSAQGTAGVVKELHYSNADGDFDSGDVGRRSINADEGYIQSGAKLYDEEGYRDHKYYCPWYITGFTFRVGFYDWANYIEYFASESLEISSAGSYKVYIWKQWEDNYIHISKGEAGSSTLSNEVTVEKLKVQMEATYDEDNKAYCLDSSDNWVELAYLYPRQQIFIKAVPTTGYAFERWDGAVKNKYLPINSYYMENDNRDYKAYFTNTQYGVTFMDEDKTTPLDYKLVDPNDHASASSTPTKPSEGGTSYDFDKWVDDSGVDMTSALSSVTQNLTVYASYIATVHEAGRYIIGKFGECNWGIAHAVNIPYVEAKGQFKGNVTLEYGDEFKIAWFDGAYFHEDSYCGYINLVNSCGAYHYFGPEGDNDWTANIKCYARGTYMVYFNGNNNKISIELASDLNAEHLAAQLMQFGENPESGHCGDDDRFPAMRTLYLSLDAEEQSTFQGYASSSTDQFRNAYNRYTTWARKLGEDPWSNSKALSRFAIFSIDKNLESSNFIAVIVATSIAIFSFSGYLIYHRRKEK